MPSPVGLVNNNFAASGRQKDEILMLDGNLSSISYMDEERLKGVAVQHASDFVNLHRRSNIMVAAKESKRRAG